jgi:hypothetical protein
LTEKQNSLHLFLTTYGWSSLSFLYSLQPISSFLDLVAMAALRRRMQVLRKKPKHMRYYTGDPIIEQCEAEKGHQLQALLNSILDGPVD